MKKITVRNVLVVFVSVAMVHGLAASASIGIATTKGSFRVDDSYVAGNATLFDGVSVETGVSTSELNLSKAKVVMATDTRGRVYQDRLILDRGKVQWGGSSYRTLAGELQVIGVDGVSKSLVSRSGETVQVASLSGDVKVLSASGETVMVVAAGTAYDFTPEPQGASPGDKKNESKSKRKAAASVGKVAKLSTGSKILITVAAFGAGGAAAGVLATRDSGVANSR